LTEELASSSNRFIPKHTIAEIRANRVSSMSEESLKVTHSNDEDSHLDQSDMGVGDTM